MGYHFTSHGQLDSNKSERPAGVGLRLEKTDQSVAECKCVEVKKVQVLTNICFIRHKQRCMQIR